MIDILGTQETEEYQAAKLLRSLVAEAWPDVDQSAGDRVYIIPAAKCYGQQVQDIDLVVICKLRKPKPLPRLQWMTEAKQVLSFVLTVEIKGHHGSHIEFEGPKVFVRYAGALRKDASEQSHKQKYALLGYLNSNKVARPHVVNLLWLTSFSKQNLPDSVHNVLGAGSDWNDFLVAIAEAQHDHLSKPGINLLSAFTQTNTNRYLDQVIHVFTRRIVDTPLDRKRVERITKRLIDDQQYASKLGTQLLIFRGRGGTGKTITLARLAHDLYNDRSQRSLILTYNLTLVADIKRTLAIVGVPYDRDGPVVAVQSVYSFMLNLMKDAGLIPVITEDALNRYDELLPALVELSGAFSAEERPPYDFVFVDEAQDWPVPEKEILFNLFGPQRCIVADGIDQLVRSSVPTNWASKLGQVPFQVVPLKRSLRLKSSIAEFANELSQELGLPDWGLQVNREVHGGWVTVLIGDISEFSNPIGQIFGDVAQAGNKPIDTLVCVPNATGNPYVARAVSMLDSLGIRYWDGTNRENRLSFPNDVEQTRLVTYESCRGLEGWAVICVAMDRLFDQKVKHFAGGDSNQTDLFLADEERARRHASAWTMIPVTRAIDHLVLHIQDPDHYLAQILSGMCRRLGGEGGSYRLYRSQASALVDV